MFPLLQLAFQFGDLKGLLTNRTEGATLYGATDSERTGGAWRAAAAFEQAAVLCWPALCRVQCAWKLLRWGCCGEQDPMLLLMPTTSPV